MRRIIPVMCGVLLVLALAAQPASATPPTDVGIVATTYWADGSGTFSLTGSGFDGCQSGTTVDLADFVSGREGVVGNFHVRKEFTCTDGSGTFTLLIQAQTRDLITDEGTWTVLSGTGDYEKLHGTGGLLGTYLYEPSNPNDVGIIDEFAGAVHVD